MQITFNNEGNHWIAEFAANGDFNLHIEKADGGFLYVQQRTSESGQYDSIKDANFAPSDNVIDFDFTGVVYPKYIRVVSKVEPTLAMVTFAE